MWTLGITLWLISIATAVYEGLVLLDLKRRRGWRVALRVYRQGWRWQWPAVRFWISLAVAVGGTVAWLFS